MSRTQVKENCGRCIWFDPPSSECRVGAPGRGGLTGVVAVWPKVMADQWCGRFRECPQFALNREDAVSSALDA